MSARYIDIDSTYRNRTTYPKPGDFVLPCNTKYQDKPSTALDPVLLAFPYDTNLLSGGSTTTQLALSVTSSIITNFYKGSFIEINGEFREIIAYNETVQIATVDIPFSVAPPALTQYTLRKALPLFRDTLTAAGTNRYEVVLPATASTVDNFYVGSWIFWPGSSAPLSYEWQRIISYDGATQTAIVAKPFSVIIPIGEVIEVLSYSYDNAQPLRYNGTEIFSNPYPQSIRLANLIVPNRPISGGYGGTLENYSHIYVSIYSEKGNTWNSPIESNNPNAKQALFKVPVTFFANTSWLTLQSSDMSQRVAFRENDTLHFKVTLPNGDVLDFEPINQYIYQEEFKFPIEPDPLGQIQAVFELVR
jgi:hypothetical protein